jgi:hypothetical protein
MGSRMTGRRDHLVVEHNGERPADILLGRFGEFARAGRIEAEVDHRFAGALVEAGLRVDEIAAGNHRTLLNDILGSPLPVENFRIGRRVRRRRLFRRHRLIDHAKIELGGFAQNLLEPRGILQARNLHENAEGAFTLDGRLDQSELVDAALDNLDRLIDGLAHAFRQRCVRRRQCDQAGILSDIDAALPRSAEYPRQRLRQLAQLGHCVIDIGVAGNAHFDAVAVDRASGEGNARRPKNAQHVVGHALELLLAYGGSIDLEQQA